MAYTILVADDMADIREVVKAALDRPGYRVVEAVDGKDAIEVAARERPQLILMDLYMPGFDGFTAIWKIREMAEMKGVLIVAVTAYGELGIEKHLRRQADAVGCDAFLTKPFDPSALTDLINNFLPIRPEA